MRMLSLFNFLPNYSRTEWGYIKDSWRSHVLYKYDYNIVVFVQDKRHLMMVITASPNDGYYSVTWWWLFQNRIMHTIFDIYIFITHCIVMKLNSTWQTIITCNFLITNKWDFITQLWKNSRKHIWCPANHIFSMDAYLGAYFFLKDLSIFKKQHIR
jgi:hypothetical protein